MSANVGGLTVSPTLPDINSHHICCITIDSEDVDLILRLYLVQQSYTTRNWTALNA
jgi:hypothetical protein